MKTRTHYRRGFALIITLALLAFLLLILLGLAAYIRIESRVADNSTKQAQAKQNALMALNIALGHLQKYAGPDQRVTATADSFGGVDGTRFYVGVWDATTTGSDPLIWLVSGNEGALTYTPTTAPSDVVELVGANTAGAANIVVAKKIPLVVDLAGASGVTIGNYAWWVGDEGVKASVGLPDRVSAVSYAPWDSTLRRHQLRLHVASTPNYFRNTATLSYGIEPQIQLTDALARLQLYPQLKHLTAYTADTAFWQNYFFDFTTTARFVLASTRNDALGGLMRDLSISPGELGAAFAAYADYTGYMEAPDGTGGANPSIADGDSPRRRYRLTEPVTTAAANGVPALTFSVAPVITDFLLQFGVDRSVANEAFVKVRAYVGLWNPYTSALIPPTSAGKLTLEVSGLPTIQVSTAAGASASVDLQTAVPTAVAVSGGGMSFDLQFATTSSGSSSDKASWLPGRLYFWVTANGGTNELSFYNKTVSPFWSTPPFSLPGAASNTVFGLTAPSASNLVLTLKSDGRVLSTYRLPTFDAVNLQPNTTTWKIAYNYRLLQPSSLDAARSWLEIYDPRNPSPPTVAFAGFDPNLSPFDPSAYNLSNPITSQHLNQYLIFRISGTSLQATSANNDVPLFELPRGPILSLGQLQHLQVGDQRPFAIGNSWGGTANRIFDGFFVSGLTNTVSGPDLSLGQRLPNWNLLPLDTRVDDGTPFDVSAIKDENNPLSSRFLMQEGGFNVNSTRVAAWRAVLSALRFSANAPFVRADIGNSGSQNGSSTIDELFNQDFTLGANYQPFFTRFPQSAGETYHWTPDSTPANHAQVLRTQAFRMGLRAVNTSTNDSARAADEQLHSLTTDQIELLAQHLVTAIRTRHAQSGPYRNLEQFLSGDPLFAGKSAMEQALVDARINSPELSFDNAALDANGVFSAPGFSSLTLTQADLLTALAPVLRARSDTFTVRSYGETLNPATGAVEARAYLEATLQRLPSLVDSTDNIETPSSTGSGRRIKLLAIRWLSPSDI